jgi:hypothetical protein
MQDLALGLKKEFVNASSWKLFTSLLFSLLLATSNRIYGDFSFFYHELSRTSRIQPRSYIFQIQKLLHKRKLTYVETYVRLGSRAGNKKRFS